MKQSTLLAGRLLQEQLARPARQAKHVNGSINRSWRGLLDVLQLAQQAVLPTAHRRGLPIEKLLADAAVELVDIHDLDAVFDLVVAGLEPPGALCTGRLLDAVRGEHCVAEPLEDGRRDDQLAQDVRELTSEDLLPCVRLRTFSAVACTVIVRVLTLLQLAYQHAAAMAAAHQPGVREIVFHFAGAIRRACIQQFLDPLPNFAAHQRLVCTRVGGAVPIEVAHIQAFPQNLVDDAAVEAVAAKPDPFRVHLLHQRLD